MLIKKILLIVFLATGLYLTANYIYFFHLTRGIKNYISLSITVNEEKYQVTKGQLFSNNKEKVNCFLNPLLCDEAYRISIFHMVSLEQPLFLGLENDHKSFLADVSNLLVAHEKFKKAYGLEENKNILPVNFLSSLAKVSEAYILFLDNPSKKTASNLLDVYDVTVINYQTDTNTIKKNINNFFSNNRQDHTLYALASKTTGTVMIDDLETIIKNSHQLSYLINNRRKILKSFSSFYLTQKDIKKNNYQLANNYVEELLPITELNIKKGTEVFLKGPYLVETSCFAGEKRKELVYVFDTEKMLNKKGSIFEVTKLATDNFYEKLEGRREAEKYFLNKGYTWRSIRESKAYRCHDLTYQVELLNTHYFFSNFTPILSQVKAEWLSKNSLIKEQVELEENFFSTKKYLNKNLSNAYQQVYKEIKENSSSNYERDKLMYDLQKRIHLINNKTRKVGVLLNHNAEFLKGIVEMKERLFNNILIDSFLALKHHYSLTLFSFSKAVWQINEQPKYVITTSGDNNKRLERFASETELREKYPLDKIRLWAQLEWSDILELM